MNLSDNEKFKRIKQLAAFSANGPMKIAGIFKYKDKLLFLLLPFIMGMASMKKSEVFVISTIHGMHNVNASYTYDSLFAFIDRFDPEIIGVEIRSSDIDSSISYLKRNYPYEMYRCLEKYPSKSVLGFDFLGDDIEGKAIPGNYWKEISPIKILQQKMSDDTIMHRKLSVLKVVQEQKENLASYSSLFQLNDGRYDLINHVYYVQLELLLKGTQYEALSDFYKRRDEMIARNISKIIESNKGKKMIFLLGADHRSHTLRVVTHRFKDSIILNRFD